MHWIKQNSTFSVGVLLDREGPLLEEYRAAAPLQVWKSSRHPAVAKVLQCTPLRQAADVIRGVRARAWLKALCPSIIISNTVAAFPLLDRVGLPGIPSLSFVRELDIEINRGIGAEQLLRGADRCHHLLAVSEAVRTALVQRQGMKPEKVITIPGCLPIPNTVVDREMQRRRLRQLIQCEGDESRIIIGVGTGVWRKGIDLFVQLAGQLNSTTGRPPVHCVWLGDVDSCPEDVTLLQGSMIERHVAGRIHFFGSRPLSLIHI